MATKNVKSSNDAKFKKQFGAFFNSLSAPLKASSRRVQLYGNILFETMQENGIYASNPLCSKAGQTALKNALKFYNIGIVSLTDSSAGQTDLDGMSDGYKSHVDLGLELFDSTVDLEQLSESSEFYWHTMRDVLAYHHERWDGTGYPLGTVAGDIPLSARICAVCNEFETLTTASMERDKMTTEAAAEEIAKRSDTYFDPLVVDALNKSVDKINAVLENGTLAKVTVGKTSVRSIEQLYRVINDYANHVSYGYQTDIRLNDSQLGVVKSQVFIPVAEKSSKINELVKWSVEEACDTISSLKKRNRFTGVFFVPMSVKSLLKKNFVENVTRIVNSKGVPAEEICFVVPENMFTFDIHKISEAVDKLRQNGFAVAVGGFGSEYSNLSLLQNLEVDYIFLNPDFVENVLESIRAKKVVESVVKLANKLDIMVVADGVTTKEQAEALYIMGCNLMCGPRFGRFTAVSII